MSNLRQLGLAFTMYLNDHDGRFPRPAQLGFVTPEDWIYYQSGRDRAMSPIARYLSKPFNADVYRCPSDNIESHIWASSGGQLYQYPFSYSVNELICRIAWKGPTLRLSQIRNSAEKILIVDESSATIDDGCWAWAESMGNSFNVMSNRHDRKAEKKRDPNYGRGNVAFVDGHVSFIQRNESFDPRYYDPRR